MPRTEPKPTEDHTHHVTIQRVSDGLTRVYTSKGERRWDGGLEWFWSEGNFACDCNRGHCFALADPATPAPQLSSDNYPCGDGGYRILSVTQDDDPTVLYRDAPDSPTPQPFRTPEEEARITALSSKVTTAIAEKLVGWVGKPLPLHEGEFKQLCAELATAATEVLRRPSYIVTFKEDLLTVPKDAKITLPAGLTMSNEPPP